MPPDIGNRYVERLNHFYFFYQYTALSSRTEDSHQMYSGGSVVGKASLIDPEVSTTPLLIFTGWEVKKREIFDVTELWETRVWKCSKISELWNKLVSNDDRRMSFPSLGTLDPAPLRTVGESAPPPKIGRCKCAKASITQPLIVRFRPHLLYTVITWHLMYHKLSKSRVQR